jgi:RNA polymerase sigma factor (sigma-70 family)
MNEVKLLFLKLRRLLYSRGHSQDDTEDLIQEAFLRLQQYTHGRTVNQPEAFLVRTVLNLLADRRRKHREVLLVPDAVESLALIDPNPSPDVVWEGQQRLRMFKAALRQLSPRRREVFILNRIEGYSFAQIAQKLGISVSMAEKHAARAMLSLADLMEDRE